MNITVTDQTGRSIVVPDFPMRIISLVPSQTELLYFLNLQDRVVGITKFCIHPKSWHEEKTRVGGTKILKHGVIAELKPDLIIANKEENTREDIEKLSQICPVWVSNVNSLTDALTMIKEIGKLTQATNLSLELVARIESNFSAIEKNDGKRILYLIWRKPFMAVGKGTFVDDMLTRCGFVNVITDSRYPELTESDIVKLNPEVIFFSSEPYPFKEHHMQRLQQLLPYTKMQLVDGEPFSWYGSRLLTSVPYFNKLIQIIQSA